MYKEFTVLNNDNKEVDWVSPVMDLRISDKIYVYNGVSIYKYPLDTKFIVRDITE